LSPSGSLLFSQMYNLKEKSPIKILWIGLSNYQCVNKKEEDELTELYKLYSCIPIFIPLKLRNDYTYYYENVLKPLFYNFKGLYDDYETHNKYDDWQCFKTVNEKFSVKIIETKDKYEEEHSSAFIWLNNHQLFLVPQYLRRRIKDCNIGLYMHSPFPSSDIFRMTPYRNVILKSILECDCIGFHVFEQARHFMV
jgi:trehalose 6-phosphate synthase/phosphatase